MEKRIKFVFVLTVVLIAVSAFIFLELNSMLKVKSPNAHPTPTATSEIVETGAVKQEDNDSETGSENELTLEQKVGQMFIGGYHEENIINDQVELTQERQLGGIILMGVNVRTPELRNSSFDLINNIEVNSELPLIISVDEEGTVITRLSDQLNEQTPQSDLERLGQARTIARRRGQELNELGFNVVYSPVMDYATQESFLYTRSFHVDKSEYAELGSSMLGGYKEGGVVGVPKHFPGHPPASLDSHKGLPVSDVDEDLFDDHISQFIELLEMTDPQIIMTGHILFPAIDPDDPATLSSSIIQDKLREELGYEGLIITDDLNMDAISERYTPEEAAVKAVEAGNDIVLYVSTIENQERALDGILEAVRSGRLSEERINESVERIRSFKESNLSE